MDKKLLVVKSLIFAVVFFAASQFLFGEFQSRKLLFKGNPATNVNVSLCAGISGKTFYYRNNIELTDIFMKISEDTTDSTLTDTSGFYKFRVNLLQDYAVTPEKLDTGLTGVSAFDASLVLRYSAGKTSFDTSQKIAADVSGNKQATSYDASLILRRMVGKIDSFPSGAWRFDPESRSYTGLNYSASSQNYTGIKKGDPSGNWSAKGTLMSGDNKSERKVFAIAESNPAQVTFSIKKGETFIKLKNINTVSSVFLRIKYNSDDISIIDVVSLQENQLLDWNVTSTGVLKVALAGQGAINPEQELIRIKFTNKSDNSNEARFDLSFAELDENIVLVSGESTEESQILPISFGISEGYPNPFSQGTSIRYQVASVSKISLKVFDVSGRVVKNLINKEMLPGFYSFVWNGKGNNDKQLAGGVYFLDFTAKSPDGRVTVFKKTRKLLLLK